MKKSFIVNITIRGGTFEGIGDATPGIGDARVPGAFPPNPSWACSGCEFAVPCEAVGGGS